MSVFKDMYFGPHIRIPLVICIYAISFSELDIWPAWRLNSRSNEQSVIAPVIQETRTVLFVVSYGNMCKMDGGS